MSVRIPESITREQLADLVVKLLEDILRLAPPGQTMLQHGDKMRVTSYARLLAEQLAPFGISVDIDLWFLSRRPHKERQKAVKKDPSLKGRAIIAFTGKPIVLAAEEGDEISDGEGGAK